MKRKDKERLVAEALAARERASAPYSGFAVGAALLSADGTLHRGANVESVSYGLTCCAERVALFKALTDGYTDFVAMAVVARHDGGVMPCGACRQLLVEYAPKARILVADAARPHAFREYLASRLLPGAFRAFTRGG
ncbi:MAG: cytidine deaminase [Verrucomicrobiales bacterium]|nr:cytidine deaminase [Verrucomicrobiales bacterium]